MPRFRIEYVDPETEEATTHEQDYDDWIRDDGTLYATARQVAEDHAYMLADKGSFTIIEI